MNIKAIYGIQLINSTIYRYMKVLNISSIIRKKKKKYFKVKHQNIVSYNQSRFIDNDLVLMTVKQAVKNVPYKQKKGLILYSD